MECVPPSCGTHRPLCEVAPRESAGPLLGTLLGGASNLEVPVQGIYIISHREHARGTGRRLFLGRPGECERFPRTRICGIPRVSTAVIIIRNTQDKTPFRVRWTAYIFIITRRLTYREECACVCVSCVCVYRMCIMVGNACARDPAVMGGQPTVGGSTAAGGTFAAKL
jgi:hypothetical protein